MPRYVTTNGRTTTATDPQRAIWYGMPQCGFWTDDWDTLKKVGPGVPVCPSCGSPGMMTAAGAWDVGAKRYNADHPGYAAFLDTVKGQCLKPEGGLMAAWERRRLKADPAPLIRWLPSDN